MYRHAAERTRDDCFTTLQALGARDVVCKHSYRQIVESVSECLACDHKVLPVT
jgi:hypothetical protein